VVSSGGGANNFSAGASPPLAPDWLLPWSSLAFVSVTLFFGIKVRTFYTYLENDNTDLRQIFFRVYGKKLVYYNLH